jgi:LTR polyprotein gag-polypeptide-like protein
MSSVSTLRSFFKPPALTFENYDIWAPKMEMLLKTEKLWSIVSGKRPRPEGGSEDKSTKAQIEWDEDAERAVALIFLCLGDMAERHVTGIDNPVEMWEKIKEVYSTSGFSARCNIWVRLFSVRFEAYGTSEKYVNEIRQCCQLLKGAGFEVHDEIQCSALIRGLGPPFEQFVASISQFYRRKETIKFDELVSQLFDEERRKNGIMDDETDHYRAYRVGVRKPLVCWHCKKEGHKEENCYEKYPEKRPGGVKLGKASAAFSVSDCTFCDHTL